MFTLGVTITAVALGAVSYVSAANDSVLTACANKKTGVMRLLTKGSCSKSESKISWNIQGLSGTQGLQGPRGANGLDGPMGSTGPSASDFASQNICGAGGTSPCTIGSIGPGGGYVFFIDTAGIYAGFDYLEVAPADASTNAVFGNNVPTCGISSNANCESNLLTSVAAAQRFQGIGKGLESTNRIYNHYQEMGATLAGTATLAALNYTTSRADDWYLPTRAELDLVYQNIHLAGLGGFSASTYWTSSEIASLSGTDPSNAWVIDFRNTQLYTYSFKNVGMRVRAIRSF